MRALIIFFLMIIGSQTAADCGNLCNEKWWKTSTITDVKQELTAGVNIIATNAEGLTPLHSAAMYGTGEMIEILLAAGADISARNECGSTPLHSAASLGTVETIQALLDGGADVLAEEADGWTPLHRAASCFDCSDDTIHLLLNAGASVLEKDEDDMTPWDYAQKNKTLKGSTGYFALKEAYFK